MTRALAIALAGIALAFILPAPVPAERLNCTGSVSAVLEIIDRHGESRAWTGVDRRGWLVSLYTSAAGTWTMIGARPDGKLTCIFGAGDGSTPAPARPRGKRS